MGGQLTLDGDEVPAEAVVSHRAPPLTAAQATVMRRVEEWGSIRTVEAGVIAHEARGRCATAGSRWQGFEGGGLACCPYAAVDGLELLNRLMRRGLLRRAAERGVWERPPREPAK
jgi:hypothetical protein